MNWLKSKRKLKGNAEVAAIFNKSIRKIIDIKINVLGKLCH